MSWIIEYKVQENTTIKRAQYLTDMLNEVKDAVSECEFDEEGVPTNLEFIKIIPTPPY